VVREIDVLKEKITMTDSLACHLCWDSWLE